ncbi:uroporphyrinogen-III synthase [Primorskyibacter sp. S87]|uniref:uroporphyrinogen-III synthase n=1 Tax=Primorskyibacter sp. S87 TaxID=3415126 RepID=UPI003C7AB8F5
MPVLLLTRPEVASHRFLAQLTDEVRGLVRLVVSPLLEIKVLPSSLDLSDCRGVIFTSVNGVESAATMTESRGLPAFCVGEATAKAARVHGWNAEFHGVNAEAMIESLRKTPPDGPLCHLSGVHTRMDVAAHLGQSGILTRSLPVYDQALCDLTDEAKTALSCQDPVVAPIFSPRTARHFAKQNLGCAPLHLVALSAAVAEPLQKLDFESLEICESPTAKAAANCVESVLRHVSRVEGTRGAQ